MLGIQVTAWTILLLVVSVVDAQAESRVWRSGRHEIKAEFVSMADGQVILRREDGTNTRPIPLEKLSEEDQKVARDLAAAMEPAPVPEPADEEETIETIRKLGVRVTPNPSNGDLFVKIEGPEITDEIFTALAGLPKITRLSISPGTRVTGEGLAQLETLPGLWFVELKGITLSNEAVAAIGRLRNLSLLRLSRCSLTDESLASLRELNRLARLDLTDTGIGDAGLVQLKHLTTLNQLFLGRTRITDTGLAHLEQLTGLYNLDLKGTKITDAGLVHLEPLKKLNHLDLSGTKITDAGVVHFKPLRNLTTLTLEATAVTSSDATQEILPHCQIKGVQPKGAIKLEPIAAETRARLKALGVWVDGNNSVRFDKESKGTVADLEGVPGILFLIFEGCALTDADLSRLKNLPEAKMIVFDDVPITDDDLIHFQDLKGGPLLCLHGTKVTEAAVKKFRAPFDAKAALGLPALLVNFKP